MTVASLHGKSVGLHVVGRNLVAENTLVMTNSAIDASITLAAPVSTSRSISIQLKRADGAAIAHAQVVELHVLADSGGLAWAATGGSTGLVEGASGKLLTVTTKKIFKAITTAAGLLVITWTDNASEVAYLGVKMPTSCRMVISSALTI